MCFGNKPISLVATAQIRIIAEIVKTKSGMRSNKGLIFVFVMYGDFTLTVTVNTKIALILCSIPN